MTDWSETNTIKTGWGSAAIDSEITLNYSNSQPYSSPEYTYDGRFLKSGVQWGETADVETAWDET